VQAVDARVGTLEPAGARHVGVDDECGDIIGSQLARPAVDLGEPEPVERESRVPDLAPLAGQGVVVGGDGGPERLGAELTVLQHLGVAERDLGAGRSRHRELDDADQVLAEVDDRAAARRRRDLDRPHPFGHPDRGRARRGQRREIVLDRGYRRPR
jgi:hypothetical protein